MEIDYDIDQANKIVYVLISGLISTSDIQQCVAAIRTDLNFNKNIAALIDARDLRRAFFVREGDNLVRLLGDKSARFISRYAFIVGQDFANLAGRRFLIKAKRQGIKLEVFRDHAAALKWLRP